jgi:hypothetical protein
MLQFSHFLTEIHPAAGQVFLLIATILLVIFLIYSYLKIKHYPVSMEKPDSDDSESLEAYKKTVLTRLNKNKILRVNGLYPETDADVSAALNLLDSEAEKVIMENASWVFVSTAISQNGKLDGLITLFVQMKMIYRISKIYYQKPRLKELYKLYSNVMVTVFLVSQIEDLDISRHLEPVVSKINPAEMIPAIGKGISLLTNMLFEGSANCYLTLRIGLITRKYCNFQNFDDERAVRNNASKEAAGLLGKIISDNSGKISRAFFKVVKNMGTKTVLNTSGKIKDFIAKPFKKA